MAYANEDQRKMAAVWRSKGWKQRREELLVEVPRCEWCNGKSYQINHKRQGYYEGYELARREEVDVICRPCHDHFTKTGQRRNLVYDTCSSCEALIYKGRKVCFNCGGVVIQVGEKIKEKRDLLIAIVNQCPEVQIGDRWKGVWSWPSEVVVTKFERQDTLPWPMVKTNQGEVGLPAFMFGKRVAEGEGASWRSLFAVKEKSSS